LPRGTAGEQPLAAESDLVTGSFAAFLGISLLVIVTPGPDTATTLRNTLIGGRAGGIATALGIASGQVVWAIASSAGIAALLIASGSLFRVLQLAGAAYLAILGVQALLRALYPRDEPQRTRAAGRARLPAARAFRQGLASDLANPKMAVFFTSLLPQFAPDRAGAFAILCGLGLVFCVLTFLWLTLYAIAAARAADFLGRPRIRRALEGVIGVVMIALGLRIATERG
jgi:threonine/homoserine/homoserine lactone efflux protein